MKVELSEEARAQPEQIDAWWRENRRAAPNLFSDELELALLSLEDTPTLGVRYAPRPNVRRLLLRRTHYHLYVNFTPWRPRQGEVAPSTLNCLLGGYRSPGLGVGPRLGSPSRGPLGGMISYLGRTGPGAARARKHRDDASYSHLAPNVKRDAVQLLDSPKGFSNGNLTATRPGTSNPDDENPGKSETYRGETGAGKGI